MDNTQNETFEAFLERVEKKIEAIHKEKDKIAFKNQGKVIEAFQQHQVSDFHFTPSTGYGYDDVGRETLEEIYADVFGGEAALVRPQIISGTHAIATCLFGVLRPGDELIYITGKPYDTLEEIVGIRGNGHGSLKEFQIDYRAIPLQNEWIDEEKIKESISEKTKMIGIQRSRGYDNRPSFTIEQIKRMIEFIKSINEDIIIFVDNCYGEFVEEFEPCHVGADLIAGSLIKNPGGGIVKTGGYIVGKQRLIELASYRLAAPGIGKEGGATLYSLQEMYQGFFLAPHVVAQALKGAIFTAACLEERGLESSPKWNDPRTDLIQSVSFPSADEMIQFCQSIQLNSPINSHVTPYPSSMPGYESEVIMAAGTFIQGASIELTADGPIRPPYTAYVQGGLTYEHVKYAIIEALKTLDSLKK
ncbi:putative aluminum resistance protein [Bacillus sp. TS-2]|nr:putative aluminum resistance protein [Bacillus sp. TS-2]